MFHYFRVSENFVLQRVVTIFSRNFLSHSTEKLRRENLLCCVSEHFRLRKRLWIRGGGGMGVSKFSVESFLPQSAGNFRRGNLLCCVAESFW